MIEKPMKSLAVGEVKYIITDAEAREDIETLQTNVTNINTDITEIAGDVTDLKSQIDVINDELFDVTYTGLVAVSTQAGVFLASDGHKASGNAYTVQAYSVSPGDTIHLEVAKEYNYQSTYMFQNSLQGGTVKDGVPSSAPNEYLVGDVVDATINGNIIVPTGASYLIISYKTVTGAVVQVVTAISAIKAINDNIGDLDDLDTHSDSLVGAINTIGAMSNPGIATQYAPIKASIIGWENKSINASTGATSSNTTRLKCVSPLPVYIGAIQPISGYQYCVFAYDDGTYVGWWDGAKYVKESIRWAWGALDLTAGANNNAYDLYLVVKNTSNTNISAESIDSMIMLCSTARPIIDAQNVTAVQPLLRNGSNADVLAASSVSMACIYPCVGLSSVGIVIKRPSSVETNHYRVTVTIYDTPVAYATGYTDANSHLLDRISINLAQGETTYVYDLASNPTVKGIAFDLSERDNTDSAVIIRANDFGIGDVALVLNRLPIPVQTNNFMICPGFGNRPVYVPLEGYTVKYQQAFLMYDGKIYSTDGSNVAEQDSDFTVLRDVPLVLGHGNSFQLGSEGKGYVSGWDDNNLYVVDLSTLILDNTIALPTTGYTTAVINEDANLIYIFQRETRPNTAEIYNFIVYDYINRQTIATYKTPVAIRAMQSVDYYRGRIFVTCGNTDGSTHGFYIFDTMCNLICEYKLPDFDGKEAEGVFIDRTNGTVYLMFDNKGLYKIVVD